MQKSQQAVERMGTKSTIDQEKTAQGWGQAELTDCYNKCQHFIRREDRENNNIVTRLRDKDLRISTTLTGDSAHALKDSEETSSQ